MDKTAMKPATPLPWKLHREFEIGSINLNGDGDYAGQGYSNGDANYILAACNAYPQLVAAAKHAMETMLKRGVPTQHELLESAAQIRALLRSLGEAQ